jgi:hypothetical protein
MPSIDTEDFSARLRERAIRPDSGELLISRIGGSGQEDDLTAPPNCGGYGRIRHFRLGTPEPGRLCRLAAGRRAPRPRHALR